MNHSEIRKFLLSLFFNSSDFGFKSKLYFFFRFWVDILPLGSGSVDPHICIDRDPGSQNLADPTDPLDQINQLNIFPCNYLSQFSFHLHHYHLLHHHYHLLHHHYHLLHRHYHLLHHHLRGAQPGA